MRTNTLIALSTLMMILPAKAEDHPLARIEAWLGGHASNAAQVDAGGTGHSLLHQRMTKIEEHGWEGLAYYSELSADGTPGTLQSQTVLTFTMDETTGMPLVQSWRFTGDRDPYVGAHNNPSVLSGLGPDVMKTTPGCEIPLAAAAPDRMTGTIEMGACASRDPRSGQKLYHTDNYAVGPGYQELNGKFYAEDGTFLFGNRAETPIILKKVEG